MPNDYMKYITGGKTLVSDILDGSNNMQGFPLKGKSITKGAGPKGPVDIETGAANQKPGILQTLAGPAGAVALGSIAQAIDPEGFGGRLGTVAAAGGQSSLFKQALEGGEVSNLLTPDQQAAVQQRRDLAEARELERKQAILDQHFKAAKFISDIESNQLNQQQSQLMIDRALKDLGYYDEDRALEREAALAGIDLTKAQIENLRNMERYRQQSLALSQQRLEGTGEAEPIDRKLFGTLIAKKYPQYIDLAREAISGKSTPEEFISQAWSDMDPTEFAQLLNDVRNLQGSLGENVLGGIDIPQTPPQSDSTIPQGTRQRDEVSIEDIPDRLDFRPSATGGYFAVDPVLGTIEIDESEFKRYQERQKELTKTKRDPAKKTSKEIDKNEELIKRIRSDFGDLFKE